VSHFISPELRSERGRCHTCNKWFYFSKRAARHIVRTAHPGDRLHIYRCPVDDTVWHVGHPKKVKQ
jgi:hypothetical protein